MSGSQMTADQRLAAIWLKIERAKKHIEEFNGAIKPFTASNPYVVGAKRDPQTRKLIYYLHEVRPVPDTIPLIVGDVIQCLRSALDHLAYQLFLTGTGGMGEGHHIYFLIERDAKEFKSRLARKVEGMRQEAIDAICALEPYKAGKGHELWVLHTLNNIDKHRLIVTVGGAFRSMDLGAVMHALMKKAFPNRTTPKMEAFFRPADRMCPLKAGDELFIDEPDAEPNKDLKFKFEVSLHEPEVI
jgi:hypothetical protein